MAVDDAQLKSKTMLNENKDCLYSLKSFEKNQITQGYWYVLYRNRLLKSCHHSVVL